MRIAYGFYTADSGEILIDGQVRAFIAARCHRARHRHGSSALHAGRHDDRGGEHRAGGRSPARRRLDSRPRRERSAALRRVQARGRSRGVVEDPLSVGQQQRVELLKALYRDARLLILDEPTAVLTPQEVDEFFAILRGMREQGKTVVIITTSCRRCWRSPTR